MLITPDQIRAARALLRMDQEELARRANVSVVTVRRLEAPGGLRKVAPSTVDEVQRALEAAGAEFVDRGVRQREWTPEEIEARDQTDHGDRVNVVLLASRMLRPSPKMICTMRMACRRDRGRYVGLIAILFGLSLRPRPSRAGSRKQPRSACPL